jgi:chromosome segregation ATPase
MDLMKIIGLIAENYKRLRVVEITPQGRVVQITGRNGQGKSSVLDAIWAALVGSRGIAEKPVRKGAEKARIRLELGEFTVTRTIAPNGVHTLKVENAKGTPMTSPQTLLDQLLGALSFDPLEFVGMKPQQQVETLRQVAKVEIDVDALNAAHDADYAARTEVNREVRRLEAQLGTMTVLPALPKEKLDEAAVIAELNAAGEENRKAQEQFKQREALKARVDNAERDYRSHETFLASQRRELIKLEKQLESVKKDILAGEIASENLTVKAAESMANFAAAPEVQLVDVAALTAKLQEAQATNREIDKRERRDGVSKQLREKQRETDVLTRRMETRAEEKIAAMAKAQMPIEGLALTDNAVTFQGIPLEQLGEAEQIRVSTAIAMAANPKLRVIRIMHGEALDDDSLAMLAQMAEENDFQIWMAKVDSSGTVGVVMEDGMVKE